MNINKIVPILVFFTIAVSFSSCIKDTYAGTEISVSPFVLIPEGGLAYFANAALIFPSADASDTAKFHANYASNAVAPADITVTLGYDATALAAYNSLGGIQYEKFPDSIFSFKTTTVVIKAGQSYSDAIALTVYPNKVDPSHNYMLPITISSASGAKVSGNFATIYYHIIGNPIAGTYVWDFTRYSAPSNAGSPDGNSFTGRSAVFSVVSPTQIEVKSGYYIGPRYEVTFTNTGGVLSNFQVVLNADDVATMAGAGVVVANGPNILVADPVNKVFTFQYTTLTRYVIDSYHK